MHLEPNQIVYYIQHNRVCDNEVCEIQIQHIVKCDFTIYTDRKEAEAVLAKQNNRKSIDNLLDHMTPEALGILSKSLVNLAGTGYLVAIISRLLNPAAIEECRKNLQS